MKKSNIQILKKTTTICLLSVVAATANAQKLPTVQNTGLYAPADIKIDGKPTEWNQFQAYNKNTHIFYTVANDANNLYFTVQAADVHDIQKIIAGGITLTIKNAGKNSSAMPVAVTFPRMYNKDASQIVNKIKNEQTDMNAELAGINKQFTDNAKLIQVAGIKEISDTLISVYNEQGIKAVSLFDDKKAYTYELAIPLKYVQEATGSDATFTYNIKLNGRFNALKPPPAPTEAQGGPVVVVVGSGQVDVAARAAMQELNEPTDFSGTYTIAKK